MARKQHAATSILAAATATAAAAAVAAVSQPAAASQAATGNVPAARPVWHRVTPAGTPIIADIGLARGRDGIVHVLWTAGSSPRMRVMDTPITAAGVVRKPGTLASGLFSASSPDATVTSHGLAALWDGARTGSLSSPQGLFQATRPARGGKWSAARVVATPAQGASTDGQTITAGSSLRQAFTAFTGTGILAVGLVGHPYVRIPPRKCCVYDPGVAGDSRTGSPWVAYLSLVSHRQGIFAQRLTGDGHARGAAVRLPGSSTGGNVVAPDQRIGLAGRGPRPGVFAAFGSGYPALHRVDVIKIGAKRPRVLASVGGTQSVGPVTVTADPAGRLWVAWVVISGGRPHLFARRSNPAVTRFGKTVRVALPAGTQDVWKLYLNAGPSRVDVLALTSRATQKSAAYWSRLVSPPR
jgi:hypothetical protein